MNFSSNGRRAAAAGIALVLAGSLASCAGTGSDSDEPVKLTLAMNSGLIPAFEGYVEAFESEHEGFEIEISPVPASNADYIQQLTTQSLSGETPDLLFNTDTLNTILASNNILADLRPKMAEATGSLNLDNFLPNFLAQYQVGDTVTGIPVSADSGLLYYNVDLFEKYGVELPTAEWTYDDMYEASQAITTASGGEVYGLSTPLGNGDAFFTFYPVLKAFGGEVWDEEANEFVFASDASLRGWEQLLRPYLEEFGTPYAPNNPQPWFTSGQAAMVIDSTPAVSSYRAAMEGINWDVAPSPTQDGESTTGGGSYALSISAKSKNFDGALTFLDWFYSPEGGMKAAAPNGVIPATAEGVADGEWKAVAAAVPAQFVSSSEYAVQNAVLPTAIPQDLVPEVAPALARALERVLLEGTDVAVAYKDAQDELNGLVQG